jgi:hypothetical protein
MPLWSSNTIQECVLKKNSHVDILHHQISTPKRKKFPKLIFACQQLNINFVNYCFVHRHKCVKWNKWFAKGGEKHVLWNIIPNFQMEALGINATKSLFSLYLTKEPWIEDPNGQDDNDLDPDHEEDTWTIMQQCLEPHPNHSIFKPSCTKTSFNLNILLKKMSTSKNILLNLHISWYASNI